MSKNGRNRYPNITLDLSGIGFTGPTGPSGDVGPTGTTGPSGGGALVSSTSFSTTITGPSEITGDPGLTCYVSKVGNIEIIHINRDSFTLSSGTTLISFSSIPLGYRPMTGVNFPIIFKSDGVYDTGLIGTCTISASGFIIMERDVDGDPSEFSGSCGWDDISFAYLTS
jgi:hypothetical protein